MSRARKEPGGRGRRPAAARGAPRDEAAARGERSGGARQGASTREKKRGAEGAAAERARPPRARSSREAGREAARRDEAALSRAAGAEAEPVDEPVSDVDGVDIDLLREVLGDLLAPWPETPRFSPSVDVCESREVYEVICELPGVADDDVSVSLQGDRLTIEGQKRWRAVRDDEFVHAQERGQGRFVRAFLLPFVADADAVEATRENGLLRLRVPKPRGGLERTIPVRLREQAPRPIEGPGPAPARELSAEVAEQAAENANNAPEEGADEATQASGDEASDSV